MALPVSPPEVSSFRATTRPLDLTPSSFFCYPSSSSGGHRDPKSLHFHGKSKDFIIMSVSGVRSAYSPPPRAFEVRISEPELELDQNVKPIREEEEEEEEKKQQNYHLNVGYAIRTLREEMPHLFHRELTFDIYRDDIVFKDPMNTFVGIENYKSIFWGLRFHGRMFFKALWLDIISVWQPVEDVVMVRWTVYGVPRVIWDGQGRFDGTSEYRFDGNGKIFEHRVDNIAFNRPPKFGVLTVGELFQSVACPSTPRPTYFESSSSEVPSCDSSV